MAIFSSPEAAQSISAPPLPELSSEKPRIVFSGPDCSTISVTLENTVTYTDSLNQEIKRRMQKLYTVDSANIQTITVEVKLELSTNGAITQALITVFKLDVDPHLRNGSAIGNRPNPRFFKPSSAQPANLTGPDQIEDNETYYEAYKLPLRRINTRPTKSYAIVAGTSDMPTDHLVQNFILVEFNEDTLAWTYLTLRSLLSDLLRSCPPFFLKLFIVGNHNIPDFETTTDALGVKFRPVTTGFLPTNRPPTPEEIGRDQEAKWDQFLVARAQSMKLHVFDSDLEIRTRPAVKISPDPLGTGETVLERDWNEIADLFQNPDGSPDIAKLKALNLKKGAFGAGSIFLWITLSLLDTEVRFQTDRADVFPTDGTYGSDWAEIRDRNLAKINKLRQVLSFLAPGSINNSFTTNITDVGLRVEGYTDTYGGSAANQTLSAQRALSVINELRNPTKSLPAGVAGGIDISKFDPVTGVGYGETRLAIPTPDATREARNRRVLIRVLSVVCA